MVQNTYFILVILQLKKFLKNKKTKFIFTMNQTIQYVKLWLGNNRPDIKINDREVIATSVYEEIKSQIENLEEGARLIYIQEFLNLNYLNSVLICSTSC